MLQTPTRADKAAMTREVLIHVSKALFDTYGYDGTTVRDIAIAANVTTGAIFGQFPKGKVELYVAVYGHHPLTAEDGRKLIETLKAVQTHETYSSADGRPRYSALGRMVTVALDGVLS